MNLYYFRKNENYCKGVLFKNKHRSQKPKDKFNLLSKRDLSKTKTLIDSDLESSYIPREIPSKYVRAILTNAES